MNRKPKDVFFGRFFFQAEDGIRDVERSRGLGDVYKRQSQKQATIPWIMARELTAHVGQRSNGQSQHAREPIMEHQLI